MRSEVEVTDALRFVLGACAGAEKVGDEEFIDLSLPVMDVLTWVLGAEGDFGKSMATCKRYEEERGHRDAAASN